MHNYEQLDLWQRSLALAATLHRAARESRACWADRSLWDQIARAAASIPANVAEGSLRASNREFARFLAIATGSAAELHSLVVLAGQSGLLPPADAKTFASEAIVLRRMSAALRARANGFRPPRPSRPREEAEPQ